MLLLDNGVLIKIKWQTASLGIHRNDYLLHAEADADAKTAKIQQVEFNTVSASFGSLCTRTSELHR